MSLPSHLIARRLLALLETRRGEYAERNRDVDKYVHSLQCATRVARDGGTDTLVVAALFHDVFGGFSATHHDEMAAYVLQPFIPAAERLLIESHVDCMRVVCEGIPLPHSADIKGVVFAARYDAPSFDPTYQHMPVEFFYPIIERVIHD